MKYINFLFLAFLIYISSLNVLYGSMPQNIYQMENFRSYTKELRKLDEKVDKKHIIGLLNFSITEIYNTDLKKDSYILLYCALSSGISCVLRAWLNGNYIEISKNRAAGNLCSYINRNFSVNSIYELIDQLIFLKKACLAESINSINKEEFHIFSKPHLEKCLLNSNDKFELLMLSYIDEYPSVDICDVNSIDRILSKAQKKLNSFFENIT